MSGATTWHDRVRNLRNALGRRPTIDELLTASQVHILTPEEVQAQRESWARGMAPCEHGVFDFEDCPLCRTKAQQ